MEFGFLSQDLKCQSDGLGGTRENGVYRRGFTFAQSRDEWKQRIRIRQRLGVEDP